MVRSCNPANQLHDVCALAEQPMCKINSKIKIMSELYMYMAAWAKKYTVSLLKMNRNIMRENDSIIKAAFIQQKQNEHKKQRKKENENSHWFH